MAAEFHKLKVAGIIQETHDARSFILEVPPPLQAAFAYRSGQFLTFEIPWNEMRIRRSYSLSSAPVCDPWPKVTVKRVDEGRVSNWFNDNLKVGDTIDVQPPEGRFVLGSQSEAPVFLFGGGSGITPVISILKTALRTTLRRVKLVYANRDARSVIFKDELDLWLAEYPNRLEVVHHLDSAGGFMTVDNLKAQIVGLQGADFYVCGPTGYMDAVEAAFKALSIDSKRTRFERFLSPVDPDRREDAVAPIPQVNGVVVESFKMKFEDKTIDVPYEAGATLLESAHKAGHTPPSSCEDGYCGCCMAQLKCGQVQMAVRDALTDDDVANGWILTCQSRPSSDEPIEIDYDAEY